MVIKALLDKVHHFGYAIAAIIIAFLVLNYLGNRPTPATNLASVTPKLDSVQREIESMKSAINQLAAVRAGVSPAFSGPAVAVVAGTGLGRIFSHAAIAAGLQALGRTPTAQAVHVSLSAPTPSPVRLPNGMTEDYARWYYDQTVAADLEALNKAKIAVAITQEEIAPSRIKSCYLTDRSAGICFAALRRHQLDYDLGVTTGTHGGQPFLGVEYRIRHTSFGILAGATLQSGKPTATAGFAVSF